jgi:hypothetical protein
MRIPLLAIKLDTATQPRESINWLLVREYEEELRAGRTPPPVVVFDDGIEKWLADGWHRYHAASGCKSVDIDAEVRNGTKEDAVWFASSANQSHGLRRTSADKRRAVLSSLKCKRSAEMSDNAIAEHCGVSQTLVSEIRSQLTAAVSCDSKPRISKDGKKRFPSSKKRKEGQATRREKERQDQRPLSAECVAALDILVGLTADDFARVVKEARRLRGGS